MRALPNPTAASPEEKAPSVSRGGQPSLRARLRHAWVALLVFAATLGTVAYLTARETTVYRASATMIVAPTSAVEGEGDVLRSLDTLERRSVIATFAKLPSAPEARDAAA